MLHISSHHYVENSTIARYYIVFYVQIVYSIGWETITLYYMKNGFEVDKLCHACGWVFYRIQNIKMFNLFSDKDVWFFSASSGLKQGVGVSSIIFKLYIVICWYEATLCMRSSYSLDDRQTLVCQWINYDTGRYLYIAEDCWNEMYRQVNNSTVSEFAEFTQRCDLVWFR